METRSRVEVARAFARAEYSKRDTSEMGYRLECLRYVKALHVDLKEEMRLVVCISKGSRLEMWRELNLAWLGQSKDVPDVLRPVLRQSIEGAGDGDRGYVTARLMEVYLENSPSVILRVGDPWVESAKDHYYVLLNEAIQRPRREISDEEWWFLAEVRLRCSMPVPRV